MKQVNRINQFILKNYPLVWNTRLVWLLLIGAIVHIFFFALGFFNLSDPISLHGYNVTNNFFDNGAIMISMLISTILIVGWLFFMFKNNSFKSFYPTSKHQLFRQFCIYFFIIIFNITYYYSYFYGMKIFVKLNHPSLIVDQDIALSNKAAPFFSHHLNQYEVDQRFFPKLLRELYCETKTEFINLDKPHFKFLEEYYQFYTLRIVEERRDERRFRRNEGELKIEELNDSIDLHYFKDTVIDVSGIIKTALPAYHNFSRVFFESRNYQYSYTYGERYFEERLIPDSTTIQLVQSHNALLKRNDSEEIKKLLDDFLNIARRYKIKTNLKTADWFHLINTDSFLLKNLIKNTAPDLENQTGYYNYYEWDGKNRNNERAIDENGNRIKTVRDEFIDKIRTDFYLETPKLNAVFSNIKRVESTNPFIDTIHFFLWFSFFLAALIFIYRTSGLRSLIFSTLAFGILSLILALIALGYEFIFENNFIKLETFMVVFTWVIGTVILCIPIFYLKKTNKIVSSICINISLTFFAIYMVLIIVIVTFFQENYFNWKYQGNPIERYECQTIIESVGIYWSYILFILAFIFIYYFTKIIRNWRALAESK